MPFTKWGSDIFGWVESSGGGVLQTGSCVWFAAGVLSLGPFGPASCCLSGSGDLGTGAPVAQPVTPPSVDGPQMWRFLSILSAVPCLPIASSKSVCVCVCV